MIELLERDRLVCESVAQSGSSYRNPSLGSKQRLQIRQAGGIR